MIKYPTVKRQVAPNPANKKVTTSQAHRGMRLEDEINDTCEYYRSNMSAIIYKKPTPVQVVKFKNDQSRYAISEAYFRQPSTTDYNGIYRGKYIDFEAKETANQSFFSLKNLHAHQMKHMLEIKQLGGIAFIIVGFWRFEEIYLMDAEIFAQFYYDKDCHSISISIFRKLGHLIPRNYLAPINFLPVIDKVYFDENN